MIFWLNLILIYYFIDNEIVIKQHLSRNSPRGVQKNWWNGIDYWIFDNLNDKEGRENELRLIEDEAVYGNSWFSLTVW